MNIKMRQCLQLILMIFGVNFCTLAIADAIKNYDVTVNVLDDGTIDVMETILVSTNHDEIRLGITRDIPTDFVFMSEIVQTPVEVLSVTRNDRPENFRTESNKNSVRILTGAKEDKRENYLPKGDHTYQIHWQSKNHLRGFLSYDELYFNAVGHSWRLPIEKANVILTLPSSVKIEQVASYYGREENTTRGIATIISPQQVEFSTPFSLKKYEGFTIAAGFTKGILPATNPSMYDRLMFGISESISPPIIYPWMLEQILIVIAFACYVKLALYLARRYQQSNRAFMVRYSPPDISVQLAGILYHQEKYNHKINTAMYIDLAAKRYIAIDFAIKRLDIVVERYDEWMVDSSLSEGQRTFLNYFYDANITHAELAREDIDFIIAHRKLSKSSTKLWRSVLHPFLNGLFIFGLILILGLLGISAYNNILGVMVLSIVPLLLGTTIVGAVKELKEMWRKGNIVSGIFAFIVSIVFIVVLIVIQMLTNLWMLPSAETVGSVMNRIPFIISNIIMVIYYSIFIAYLWCLSPLMGALKPQYIPEKQALLEFRHFLRYTKEDEYQYIQPDLYERYLAYAVALDVEEYWIDIFKRLYPEEYAVRSSNNFSSFSSYSDIQSFSRSVSRRSGGSSRGFSGSSSGSGGGGPSGGGSGGGGGGGR